MTHFTLYIAFITSSFAAIIVQVAPNPLSDLDVPKVVAKLQQFKEYFDDNPKIEPEPTEFIIAGVQYYAKIYQTSLTINTRKVTLEFEFIRYQGSIPQGAKAVITISGVKGEQLCTIVPLPGASAFCRKLKDQDPSLKSAYLYNAFLELLKQVKAQACKIVENIIG